jgi:hypothetical protein
MGTGNLESEKNRDMSVYITTSPVSASVYYPRQIEAQVEAPVEIPAKSCADTANCEFSFSFPVDLIKVLDRAKLEALSCECYEAVKKEADMLLNYLPQRQVIKNTDAISVVTLETP